MPTPATKSMTNKPVQRATPANANNPSSDGSGPVNTNEEPDVLMTRSEIETILRPEKEKDFVSSIFLDLKPC